MPVPASSLNLPSSTCLLKGRAVAKQSQMLNSLKESYNTNGNSHTNKVRLQRGVYKAKTDFKTSTGTSFCSKLLTTEENL